MLDQLAESARGLADQTTEALTEWYGQETEAYHLSHLIEGLMCLASSIYRFGNGERTAVLHATVNNEQHPLDEPDFVVQIMPQSAWKRQQADLYTYHARPFHPMPPVAMDWMRRLRMN